VSFFDRRRPPDAVFVLVADRRQFRERGSFFQ
jgi:hypothetical protein